MNGTGFVTGARLFPRMIWFLFFSLLSIGQLNAQVTAVHLHNKFCGSDPACGLAPGSAATNAALGKKRTADELFVSPWKGPNERQKLNLTHKLSRHDGKEVRLEDLKGSPLAISFVYTRCLNPNKCLSVTARLAELQRKLAEAQLLSRVKLALITYDPENDTEEILRQYGKNQGLTLDNQTFFLRPELASSRQLFSDLSATVTFYTSQVSMHEIKLLIVDAQGGLARTYKTLVWNNDDVVSDFKKLLEESPSQPALGKAEIR